MGERRTRWVLASLLAAAASPIALAQQPKGEICSVCEGRRQVSYLAEAPDNLTTRAWRVNSDLANKDGSVPAPSAGFMLTNQVLARVLDPQAITDLSSKRPDLGIQPLDFAPGFVAINATSVRDAMHLVQDLAIDPRLADVALDVRRPAKERTLPSDPLFPVQWHLNNILNPLFDVNAEPAWDAGYTGAGVVAGVLELSGWQNDHPDLAAHYLAEASQAGSIGSHATSCAGVLGAVANNGVMGAGVAYDVSLSQQVAGTDCQTAAALGFRNDLNDIKSNSWGPDSNGLITYLAPVVRASIENAIATGRDGRGEVIVWAAGNSATSNDRVDYDPYASSRFTIAVGSIGDLDTRPTYSETGASLFVVTESDGNLRDIYTTSSGSGQTFEFGGTSSACPLAAGVAALMLQARPDLTWRDVQHVVANSARKCDPGSTTWEQNAAGHDISYSYGFGAVDAGAAVAEAQAWTPVAHEIVYDSGAIPVNVVVPDNNTTGITRTVDVPRDLKIESVEFILNAHGTYIGDLRIEMTAPSGVKSLFADRRIDQQDDYANYIFTTFRDWDELSAGTWSINISDRAAQDVATWIDYRIKIYGTLPCTPDFDSSGSVDITDVSLIVSAFGFCEGQAGFLPETDVNNDGCTNLSDLGYLLSAYGQVCP